MGEGAFCHVSRASLTANSAHYEEPGPRIPAHPARGATEVATFSPRPRRIEPRRGFPPSEGGRTARSSSPPRVAGRREKLSRIGHRIVRGPRSNPFRRGWGAGVAHVERDSI